jgi:hypothetical protein
VGPRRRRFRPAGGTGVSDQQREHEHGDSRSNALIIGSVVAAGQSQPLIDVGHQLGVPLADPALSPAARTPSPARSARPIAPQARASTAPCADSVHAGAHPLRCWIVPLDPSYGLGPWSSHLATVPVLPRSLAGRAADTRSRSALRPIIGVSGSKRVGSRQEGGAEEHAVLQ